MEHATLAVSGEEGHRMSIDDELKAAELQSRKLEIAARQKELDAKPKRFDLSHAAVLVTVIGGLSAIAFQGLAAMSAETSKQTARAQAERDFDFKSLELLLTKKSDILFCEDPDRSARNIAMFKGLSAEMATAFQDYASSNSAKCVAQQTASAPAANAEQTRYNAIAQQSTLIAAAAGLGGGAKGNSQFQVWLQYPGGDEQKAAAVKVQQALQQAEYRAPGIEHVSTAPNRYEVRYYKDKDLQTATAIASVVQSALGLPQRPTVRSLAATYKSLPDDIFEVWLPAGA
jgi:hypothetical protein